MPKIVLALVAALVALTGVAVPPQPRRPPLRPTPRS